MPESDLPLMLDVDRVSRLCKVHRNTVYRWHDKQLMPRARRPNGTRKLLWPADTIVDWLAKDEDWVRRQAGK